MFDQQMGGTDLTRLGAFRHQAAAVVFCHVDLELVRVGSRRGLPARVLLDRIEVVGQILALAVAHLPAGWKACVGLLCVRGDSTSQHTVKSEGKEITPQGFRYHVTHVAHGCWVAALLEADRKKL